MGSSERFMQVPSPSALPLQKDPGFDRGQFHKQIAVMRGQVSLGHPPSVIFGISWGELFAHVEQMWKACILHPFHSMPYIPVTA